MSLSGGVERLPLRTKVLIVLLVPILGLATITTREAVGSLHELREANQLEHGIEMAVRTGNLMHETQRERGLTSLFLGTTSDASIRTQLEQQRKLTDDALGRYMEYSEQYGADLGEIPVSRYAESTANLKQLSDTRQKADQRTITGADAAGWFTALNRKMLDAMGAVIAETPDADTQRNATAYYAWANTKEQTGVERARLVVAFTNDAFAKGQLAVVTQSMGAQQGFLSMFRSMSSPETNASVDELMKQPVWTDVTKFEQIALEKADTGRFGVSGAEWYRVVTAKIDAMGEFEQRQVSSLAAAVDERQAAAQSKLIEGGIFSLASLLVSIVGGLYMTRLIIRRLDRTSVRLRSASATLSNTGGQLGRSAEMTTEEALAASAASEEVSMSVQTVASAAEELTSSIGEISSQTAEASVAATAAVDVARSARDRMAKLSESSAEIGKVVDVITAIAEQTNLLALNATIEAARAGDAGKGFAVVANEVKELAAGTAKATEEIGSRIAAIQEDTGGAIASIEEVGNVIEQLSDVQTSIAGAVEQQTAAVSEIARNVNDAATGTTSIAESVTGVASRAETTGKGATDTQVAASEMTELAADLEHIVRGGSSNVAGPARSLERQGNDDPRRRFRADRPDTLPSTSRERITY